MPHLHEGYKVWVEEREKRHRVEYILVIENGQGQKSVSFGTVSKVSKREDPGSFGHSWRRHLVEILETDYTAQNPLLQYFAKEPLKHQLQPIEDITLAKKVIELLAEKEPGIAILDASNGSIAQVGERELTWEELQKLHKYFSNRNLPHPF